MFLLDRGRKQLLAQFPVQTTGSGEVTADVRNIESRLEIDLWNSAEEGVLDELARRGLVRTVP